MSWNNRTVMLSMLDFIPLMESGSQDQLTGNIERIKMIEIHTLLWKLLAVKA